MKNSLWLLASFLIGVFAIGMCAIARMAFMYTTADWFTFDYTPTGWAFRCLALILGLSAIATAMIARRRSQPNSFRRFAYRCDVAIALTAISYEAAIPIVLFLMMLAFISNSVSSPVDDAAGCLGGLFDIFDD